MHFIFKQTKKQTKKKVQNCRATIKRKGFLPVIKITAKQKEGKKERKKKGGGGGGENKNDKQTNTKLTLLYAVVQEQLVTTPTPAHGRGVRRNYFLCFS